MKSGYTKGGERLLCPLTPRRQRSRGPALRPRSAARAWSARTQQAVSAPRRRYKTKDVAGDRDRLMDGNGRRAVTTDSAVAASSARDGPDADRLLGVVVESVVRVGAIEVIREHGIAEERQPVAAGREADHAAPAGAAAGATDDHPRRHSYSSSNGRNWLRYRSTNRSSADRSSPGSRRKCCGRNRATPRTRPRRPPGGSARPDAAGP